MQKKRSKTKAQIYNKYIVLWIFFLTDVIFIFIFFYLFGILKRKENDKEKIIINIYESYRSPR